jgi:hypothetical protein
VSTQFNNVTRTKILINRQTGMVPAQFERCSSATVVSSSPAAYYPPHDWSSSCQSWSRFSTRHPPASPRSPRPQRPSQRRRLVKFTLFNIGAAPYRTSSTNHDRGCISQSGHYSAFCGIVYKKMSPSRMTIRIRSRFSAAVVVFMG